MKTIGLLGGMSWESTASYYKLLNEGIKARLGKFHSAKIVLVSVDFDEIEKLQSSGDWQQAARILVEAARNVERGGADFLLMCTNTMHKVAAEIADSISIPFVHIADTTAEALKKRALTQVGLLGTRFTMEENFYKARLLELHHIDVVVPNQSERKLVDRIIYDELCLGQINDEARQSFLNIIQTLSAQGAQAVILGCTEIALLVQAQHTKVPLFDTAAIHAQCAIDMALKD
jgi:aspartate racemase